MKKLLTVSILLFITGCSTIIPVKRNFPDVPKELLETCSELKQTEPTTKLSEVLKVVTENYSKYHECKSKDDAWIDWYKSQKHIFESVK